MKCKHCGTNEIGTGDINGICSDCSNRHVFDTGKIKIHALLTKYSEYLEKCGYMDTDWWSEEPTAVDRFLQEEL